MVYLQKGEVASNRHSQLSTVGIGNTTVKAELTTGKSGFLDLK